MPLIQLKVEEDSMPTVKKLVRNLTGATESLGETEMVSNTWPDLEEVFTDEGEIGGLAMTTDAIRALVAGE